MTPARKMHIPRAGYQGLVVNVSLEELMKITNKEYVLHSSSFLGFLDQDIATQVERLKFSENTSIGEEADYLVEEIKKDYPIIEVQLEAIGASAALIQIAREETFSAQLYLKKHGKVASDGFYTTAHPTVTLYNATPLKEKAK